MTAEIRHSTSFLKMTSSDECALDIALDIFDINVIAWHNDGQWH